MCWCRPWIRTPDCGSAGCIPPEQKLFDHSVSSPCISIELDAASVHLAHGNVIYKSQTEAMLAGLQEFCRANGVLIDRYRIRIEAVTFPQTNKT